MSQLPRLKMLSLALCLGASLSASAQMSLETLSEKHCERSVFTDNTNKTPINAPLFFDAVGLQAVATENGPRYEISVDGVYISELSDLPSKIYDFTTVGDDIWTVSSQGLRRYGLDGALLGTYAHKEWMQGLNFWPRSVYFHAAQNRLYIASGRLGLLRFDLESKSFLDSDLLNVNNDNGHFSAAVAVTGYGENGLYIAMTGDSQRGFNGILSYDSKTQKILNKAEYNKRKAGVVYPFASIYTYEDKVFLNNGGWIHSIGNKEAQTKSTILPRWISIPLYQGSERSFIRINGDLVFNKEYVMGCGSFFNNVENELTSSAFLSLIK